MLNKWTEAGDCNFLDYGGIWYRRLQGIDHNGLPFNDLTYHFVSIDPNPDHERDNGPKYFASLGEVDIGKLTDKQMSDILDSFQCDGDADNAEELIAYGAYGDGLIAPMEEVSGNNGHKLIAAMKRLSRGLESDSATRKAKLNRKVNAIGSTAAEFQTGDIMSALKRGVADKLDETPKFKHEWFAGSPTKAKGFYDVPVERKPKKHTEKACMLAKMYRNCGGQTLGAGRMPIEEIDGIWSL